MNIQQVKQSVAAKIGQPFPVLQLVRQFEEDKTTPTPWLSHWDNGSRLRVVMHQDVLEEIKKDKNFDKLALKYEIKNADSTDPEKQPYKMFVVITPRNIEATF